jgi:hypothetical protein
MSETPRLQTRAKNANQHPGDLLMIQKRKHCTNAEIAADNAKKEEDIREAERLKAKILTAIAQKEDAITEKDAKDRAGVSKKAPPRQRVPSLPKGTTVQKQHISIESDEIDDMDDDQDEDYNSAKEDIGINDETDPVNDDRDDVVDDEDDLDAGAPNPKKKVRMQKTDMRAMVREVRKGMAAKVDGDEGEFRFKLMVRIVI